MVRLDGAGLRAGAKQSAAATVAGVRTVVVSEANHRAGIAPASGHVSDTKAEENAWQGNILALAAAWMSTSNNAGNWLTAAKKYLANTYTVGRSRNGDPLASWMTTDNLYHDYALENHGFYHPTYEMVAGMSSGDSLLMARLANTNIAAQLQPFAEHNVMAVWTNNLSGMIMDSGDFAYPAGLDWELHDYEQYSFITWMAAHFNDPVARWDDGRLAQLTRYRQTGQRRSANSSGRAAAAFIAKPSRRGAWPLPGCTGIADYPTGPTNAPTPALENLTDVAVLTCRGTNGFVSISYGPQTNGSPARIMAVIEPLAAGFPSNTIVTTPRLPGIIGLGAMGSPTGGRLVNLTTNGNGFCAELQLTNGANGTTEVYFNDTGDSVGIIEVPNPVGGFANSAAASFSTGIENDPLCGGSRLLEWSNGSATITNRSGASKNVTNNWICVSGNYGDCFGPAGYLNYTATTSLQPPRRGGGHAGFHADEFAHAALRRLFSRQKRVANFQSRRAGQLEYFRHERDVDFSRERRHGAGFRARVAGFDESVLSALRAGHRQRHRLVIRKSRLSADERSGQQQFHVLGFAPAPPPGRGRRRRILNGCMVDFPRRCAVSEFQVVPRTVNGGYGPAELQLWLNGVAGLPPTPMTATEHAGREIVRRRFMRPMPNYYVTGSYYNGNPAIRSECAGGRIGFL